MKLYDMVENDWGEMTIVPTQAGKVLLILVIVLLLALAVLIATRIANRRKENGEASVPESDSFSAKIKPTKGVLLSAKQLAFCAMAIALGTILSMVKLFDLPTGGSVTLLSMLVICLPGYWYGLGAGILTGVAYGVLQLVIDPYVLYPAQLVVDYLLAFGALGLSGLFSQKRFGLVKGFLAGALGRYVFAVISGWIFFGSYAWDGWSALPYSLVYNIIYIGAEVAITVALLFIPPFRKALGTLKKIATE